MNKEDYQEHIKKLKQHVKIEEYAAYLGYHVERKGNGIYYTLKEHDSVIINSVTNRFFRNAALSDNYAKGSVINFAMYFGNNELGMDYKEAIKDLENFIGMDNLGDAHLKIPSCPAKKKQMLLLPPHAGDRRHAYAYLNKSRCIDRFVIDYFFESNHLYEDDRHNCIFVSYDENTHAPDFACKHGTLTGKSFKGDVEGCNYQYCFRLPADSSTVLYVTESVIDLMSLISYFLHKNTDKKSVAAHHYQAIASTQKYMAIFCYLKLHPEIETVYLAFDNDKGGRDACNVVMKHAKENSFTQKFVPYMPEIEGADWNDIIKMEGMT